MRGYILTERDRALIKLALDSKIDPAGAGPLRYEARKALPQILTDLELLRSFVAEQRVGRYPNSFENLRPWVSGNILAADASIRREGIGNLYEFDRKPVKDLNGLYIGDELRKKPKEKRGGR